MTDTDMKYIRLYLEDTYGLTSEKKIADAADLAADANSYHPIQWPCSLRYTLSSSSFRKSSENHSSRTASSRKKVDLPAP